MQESALLANLPYVPDDYKINPSAKYEPQLAIFAGKTGLEIYQTLIKQITSRSSKPKHILTEALDFQHSTLKDFFERIGYQLDTTDGLVQLFSRQS